MRFAKSSIDAVSFWVGAAAASLFWMLLGWARPLLQEMRKNWQKRRETSEVRRANSIETYHLKAVYRKAQKMHLAAPLFSLEEILVSPRFLAPPPQIEPEQEDLFNQHQTDLTVPYLPQDSTLAAFYQTETLSLAEALSGGTNLAIIGNPGEGKTVTLAQIAGLVAKRDPSLSALSQAMPLLLHVADLNLPEEEESEDLLAPLIESAQQGASLFNASRLPKYIRFNFESNPVLLLADGLDELPQADIKKTVLYFAKLLKTYPKLRIITTATLEYLDHLTRLNFVPLTLQTWNAAQQETFLEKWGDLWTTHLTREAWMQTRPEPIDPLLLNTWLRLKAETLTPLELTLKTWGAYAGDGRGASATDAIETHLRRLSPENTPREALETLAAQATLNMTPVFDARQARHWLKSFEPPEEDELAQTQNQENEEKETHATENIPKRNLLEKMVQSGLLKENHHHQLRFAHPVFSGYLAGNNLGKHPQDNTLADQPRWSGRTLAMQYLAANGDAATPLVEKLLNTPDPMLERNLIDTGKWLRDAPRKTEWRGKVLTALAKTLQDDSQPLGLRGQIVSALARSGDPSVAALFRQLIQTQSVYVIQLAALGSGLMQDKKAARPLEETFRRVRNTYTISAVCLALSAIGTDEALNALATALMQGEENLRRAAAEAFANHPAEGWDTLKEALEIDDILVRRSAVYGLARVPRKWAKDLLEKIQIEEEEWAVRYIATEILEKEKNKKWRAPQKLPPPSQSPWLIAFAGKKGVGIPAGSPATDVLLLALKSEETDERLAALTYLRRAPNKKIIIALYHAMHSGNIEMREAVFLALVEIAAGGIPLPEPRSIGLA